MFDDPPAAGGRNQEFLPLTDVTPQQDATVRSHLATLTEAAQRMQRANRHAEAESLLEEALRIAPRDCRLWLTLATVRRSLRRAEAEMQALDRVLALEPQNLRALLQKASLMELQNLPRAAVAIYRNVLQLVRAGIDVAPPLREAVQRAQHLVAANQQALENFIEARLSPLRSQFAEMNLRRFDRGLAILLQKQRIFLPQPSFMYYPNLAAREFHERAEFPWLDAIEAATDDIRAELLRVLEDRPTTLVPYVDLPRDAPLGQWQALNRSRRWGVYFLWREGKPNPEHIARCPRTVAALSGWPRWDVPGSGATAVFSILEPRTRIPPHHGVSNTRLVVHLPLIVPPHCRFRVGAEWREWRPGKAFVFDDTFEHEAWNDSDQARAVLILDTWVPAIDAAERAMIRVATQGFAEYHGARPSFAI